jgi:hypothetical protein
MRIGTCLAAVVLAAGCTLSAARADDAVRAEDVAVVPATESTPLYPTNRAPLLTSPMVKLPIGAIQPKGWLHHQLELEAAGMTGHLPEVSPWCKFDGNAWTDPHGEGKNGWEEVPYWLKGFGDLGYVLGDQRIIDETRRWLDAIFVAQADDGWFGPSGLRTANDGKPDLWPHMPILNAMQSYYEYTGAHGTADDRVIKLMDRYFQWELKCPDADFMHGYWPEMRTGDNLESVYWLYNRTGEAWLLDLGLKIEKHTPNWVSRIPMWHNVNLAEGFREPAEYYQQSKDPKYLKGTHHAYDTLMNAYGQVPGGGFCGDENSRPGYTDPRQGFETCGIVEFMHSFEMLTKITSDPSWADHCEDVAFNDFPAAMTPDLKALHYLTSPNSVQLDQHNRHPDIDDSGEMVSYSPDGIYRCCQHNHGMGWPYYAEELWLATSDQGLCASLYAASSVTAKVNGGQTVQVDETTDYPFDGAVTLTVSGLSKEAVTFPMYLRIPKWCDGATVKMNGVDAAVDAKPDSFLVLKRPWKNNDTVTLNLPMHVSVRKWVKNKDSVSVDYGPLTFALRIGEQWKEYTSKGSPHIDGWPAMDVYPTTPWNYGLVLDDSDPAKSFEVIRKPGPLAEQPFTPETCPIEMHVKARQIPGWTEDNMHMVGLLQQSPVKSDQPTETVTLIPMGAARLRISQFPVIGDGPDAHEWIASGQSAYAASASHCFEGDTVDALCDGILPKSSGDNTIPRFTWWDHRGTTEWVQYDFKKPMTISSTSVYWYTDEASGGNCRLPASWEVQYKDGDDWKPVAGASAAGLEEDKFNQVTFTPVTCTSLRVVAKLQPNFSAGILEWTVGK